MEELRYPIGRFESRQRPLTSEERTEGGRNRRYYRATALGREALAEARAKAKELTREVAPGDGGPASPSDS